MHTEIVVSPEDDIELRRTRITNRSRVRRTLDVTSYAEIVLATAASDNAHPAFGNLFVQTEIPEDQRSEEHTSELQSLMRISYAVFCLKKKIPYNINMNMTQDNTKP